VRSTPGALSSQVDPLPPRDTFRDANLRRSVGDWVPGGAFRVAGGVCWGRMRRVAAAF
jgi:hypothetical protein